LTNTVILNKHRTLAVSLIYSPWPILLPQTTHYTLKSIVIPPIATTASFRLVGVTGLAIDITASTPIALTNAKLTTVMAQKVLPNPNGALSFCSACG
jgi:hypothetical protein